MSLTPEIISKVKAIAKNAHCGQTDLAGVDYYNGHLTTVAQTVKFDISENEYSKIVATAYLHDILEDTNYTPEQLIVELIDCGIDYQTGAEIVNAVLLLTKQPHDLYFEGYIRRLSKNLIAKHVKLADLMHNSDLTRLSIVTEKDKQRALKYQRAIEFIYFYQ